MANVNDVANFFVDWANKSEEEHMTNLWLNKLMFYAQGQHLARCGKPLFAERIEAWDYGPVVPSIYRKYKPYGRDPISAIDDGYSLSKFTREEQLLLADVIRTYGIYSASALVTMTHKPNTPWENAYAEGQNNEIKVADMERFFKQTSEKIATFEEMFSVESVDVEGYRDDDGYLVLPADDEDEYWDEL